MILNSVNKVSEQQIDEIINFATNWWVQRISKKDIATKEQVAKFENLLKRRISTDLAIKLFCELETDISPINILAEVGLLSKVNSDAFPQKTHMDITPTEIGLVERFGKRQVIFSIQ